MAELQWYQKVNTNYSKELQKKEYEIKKAWNDMNKNGMRFVCEVHNSIECVKTGQCGWTRRELEAEKYARELLEIRVQYFEEKLADLLSKKESEESEEGAPSAPAIN